MRVLVADDDAALLKMLTRFLQSVYNAEVKTATDGAEALAALKDPGYQPELIILDHMMPKANGMKVLETIRAQQAPGGPRPKILLYSAFNLSREARAAGADGFLQKPGSVDKLKAEIERLLSGKRW